MLASRWHSPPKPLSVFSCVTGNVPVGEAVGVEAALYVALQHTDAHAVVGQAGQRALQQRGLAGPRGAHEVDDADTGAIEVLAVGARDRVVGIQRVLDDPHLGAMHGTPFVNGGRPGGWEYPPNSDRYAVTILLHTSERVRAGCRSR